MREALLGGAVLILVAVIGEIVRRRSPKAKCPRCASDSLLVLHDSDTMRECNACGHIFGL